MSDSSPNAPLFSPLVEHAIELASEWHNDCYRKSRWRAEPFEQPEPVRVPVIAHLSAVAMAVARAGWTPPVVAAAYLHDIIEDPNTHGERMTPDELRELVGDDVTRLVVDVTEPKLDAKGDKLPWRVRKEAYVEHLTEAPDDALAISLADKHHNVWTMNQTLEQGIDIFTPAPGRTALSAGPEQQCWFLHAVLTEAATRATEQLDPLRKGLHAEYRRLAHLTDTDAPAV